MADKKIRKFSKTNRRRLLVVFLFVLICFVLLVVRLVQINVKNGTDYEKNVLSLLNYDGQTIPYKRGDITDRNKTVLATSEKIYNLVLDPYVITHSNIDKASEYAKEVLEEYFSISKDDVDTILTQQPDSRYVVLKRKMTKSRMMIFLLQRMRMMRRRSRLFHRESGLKKAIRESIRFRRWPVI